MTLPHRPQIGTALVLVVFATLLLAMLGPAQAGPADPIDARAPRTGKVTVVFRAPGGVPASIRLVGKGGVAITKMPGSSKTTATAAPGRYRVKGTVSTANGRTYRPVLSRTTLTVAAGKTVTLTVRMKRVKAPIDLAARMPTSTSVTFDVKAPKHTVLSLRRVNGDVSPTSVRTGTSVPILGKTATDVGLTPGNSYSYTLFAKVGRNWKRARTATIQTATASSPSYALRPEAVFVEPSDGDRVTVASDGVVSVQPDGRPSAAVGSAVILQPRDGMPAGYLARIAAIAPDRSWVLEQGSLTDAFEQLDVSYDFAQLPAARPQITEISTRRSATGVTSRTLADSVGCNLGPDLSLSVDVKPHGSFNARIETSWHVPVAASAKVSMDPTFSLSVTAKHSVSCNYSIKASTTVPVGPVPFALITEIKDEVALSAEVSFTTSARIGGWGEASWRAGETPRITGGRTFEAATSPKIGAVALGFTAAGSVTFGPGAGAGGAAGVVVGVKASLDVVDMDITVSSDGCVKFDAKSSVGIGLVAQVWLGPINAEFDFTLGKIPFQWPGFPMGGCDPAPQPTTSASPTVTPTPSPTQTPEPGSGWLVQPTHHHGAIHPLRDGGTVITGECELDIYSPYGVNQFHVVPAGCSAGHGGVSGGTRDRDGNVFVLFDASDGQLVLRKYSPAGAELWSKRSDDWSTFYVAPREGNAVKMGADGSVVLLLDSWSSGLSRLFAVGSDGGTLTMDFEMSKPLGFQPFTDGVAVATFDGTTFGVDYLYYNGGYSGYHGNAGSTTGFDADFGADGTVFLTGYADGAGCLPYLMKYTPTGEGNWARALAPQSTCVDTKVLALSDGSALAVLPNSVHQEGDQIHGKAVYGVDYSGVPLIAGTSGNFATWKVGSDGYDAWLQVDVHDPSTGALVSSAQLHGDGTGAEDNGPLTVMDNMVISASTGMSCSEAAGCRSWVEGKPITGLGSDYRSAIAVD